MISADNQIAINGSREYGTVVGATSFAPSCEAYTRQADGTLSFTGNATDASAMFLSMQFSALTDPASNPFPLAFYQNITNQPIFADGAKCDRQVRLFNSTINQGAFAPVPVRGSIASNVPPMDASAGVQDVFGMLIDTPFVEYNGLDCQTLKGYSGTGPGD